MTTTGTTIHYRNVTSDNEHLNLFRDKITSYVDKNGDKHVKKTLLLKRTPIRRFLPTLQHDKLDDGTMITTRQVSEMQDAYIIQSTIITMELPDGAVSGQMHSSRTAIKDVFGYDYTTYKNPDQ